MERFIFEYHWCIPYEASGIDVSPFEYESIIKFQCDMLDEIKKCKCEDVSVKILGLEVYPHDFDDLERQLENNVYSLDEWFNKNKI